MEKNKEPIHPITWIIVIIAVIFIVGAPGFQFYQFYQKQKTEAEQKNAEQQAQVAAQKETDDKSRDQQIKDLEDQVNTLKNKPAETIPVPEIAQDKTADIVDEWSPRIVYIECTWAYSNGVVYAKGSGSGTLVNFKDDGIWVVTNKHVLYYDSKYAPNSCMILLSDGPEHRLKVKYQITLDGTTNTIRAGTNEDWAYIKPPEDDVLTDIASKPIKACSGANIGDKLLVLGYPAIGSQSGITVTDGIISGFDRNYYDTSAKIDHGNSGGAAVLTKDGCYLGIPSASVVGSIESLGRILRADFVIK